MTTLFTTIMTIVFIVESFIEFRLFTFLSQNQGSINANSNELEQFKKAVRLDRQWNWLSWILIIIIFITPSSDYLPLICLLCLLETLMVMRLQRIRDKYFNK